MSLSTVSPRHLRPVATAAYRLRLLGVLELSRGGEPLALSTAPARILAFLALQGTTSRASLAARLWPDADDRRARGSLRQALSALNAAAGTVIDCRGPLVSLAGGVDVDITRFVATAQSVLHGTVKLERLTDVADPLALLPGGELLPGWDEPWLDVERERLRQLRLHALEALSRIYLGARQFYSALECALEATSLEPMRESSHLAVISIHLAERNVAEAVRHYQGYEERLWHELQVRPSFSIDFQSLQIRQRGVLS